MSNNKQSSVEFLIQQKEKWGMIIMDDLIKAKAMQENEYFEVFKAGQESMEEGGKGFDQWYKETFGGNK